MTIALLTIGDEICIGQIVNTNAAWMAEMCSLEGWRVVAHSVVGDELSQIIDEFKRLLSLADTVLITGGLGPTHDDRTKTALLEFLEDKAVLHEPTLEHLKALFRRLGRDITERNATQAMLPSTCEVLQNDKGTAAGMWFTLKAESKHNPSKRDKIMVSMPGVPYEMKHLMRDRVIPRLRDLSANDPVMRYTTLLTTGIAESTLADLIGDVDLILEGQELAFLPSSGGVKLRISVTAEKRVKADEIVARIEERIRARVGRYVYGKDGDTYDALVGQLLTEHGLTIAVAESCTGGLLGAALTASSGASAYFLGGVQCYSNEAKIQFADVKSETLRLHGAVSEETALELAIGIRERFQANIGVSITGIAGPNGGTPEKPVGTIWVGIADKNGTEAHKYNFPGDRTVNRERAVTAALQLIFKKVSGV